MSSPKGEAAKLRCTLRESIKEGDRIVKVPQRYISQDWTSKSQRGTSSRRPIGPRTKPRAPPGTSRGRKRRGPRRAIQEGQVYESNQYEEGGGDDSEEDGQEEQLPPEAQVPIVNVVTRNTTLPAAELGGEAMTTQVDVNGNNPLPSVPGQETQPIFVPNVPLPTGVNWRPTEQDFRDGGAALRQEPSAVYTQFAQPQYTPYMTALQPYRHNHTVVPYYPPMTSYVNTSNPSYGGLLPQQRVLPKHLPTECQRVREHLIVDVVQTVYTTLMEKSANLPCCTGQCASWNCPPSSSSGSAATIPALDSISIERAANHSPDNPLIANMVRPVPQYEPSATLVCAPAQPHTYAQAAEAHVQAPPRLRGRTKVRTQARAHAQNPRSG